MKITKSERIPLQDETSYQPPEKRKEAGHNSGLKENNTLKIFLLVTATNVNRLTKRLIPASHQFW